MAYGDLSLLLSRRVRDAVSSASTDGKVYTASLRYDYLNKAMNELQQIIFKTFGIKKTWEILQSQVDTQALTFAGAAIGVDADYNNIPLGVTRSGYSNTFKYVPDQDITIAGANAFQPDSFTVRGGSIYVYQDGSLIASGSGTFYFIHKDTHTSDESYLLSANLTDTLVDIAAAFALSDRPKEDVADGSQFMQRAIATIKGL